MIKMEVAGFQGVTVNTNFIAETNGSSREPSVKSETIDSYSITKPTLLTRDKDPVLLSFTADPFEPKYLIIDSTKTIQTKFGMIKLNDLIGKQYGCMQSFSSPKSKGNFFILHMTPELWTSNLNHRTQILYSTDISMILFELDLKVGSRVVETGTGSGSLSHSICQSIGPEGHLYTYDYSIERVQAASKDFERHNLGNVTCLHRNVLFEGFDEKLHADQLVDAVFLDLPEPWIAIKHATNVLKTDSGRIACFCPCIEQVEKTCSQLRSFKFQHVDVKEFVLRPYTLAVDTVASFFEDLSDKTYYKRAYLKRTKFKYTHTGFLIFASFFG